MIAMISANIARVLGDRKGVTALEYGVIAAGIVIVVAAGVLLVTPGLTTMFTNVGAAL